MGHGAVTLGASRAAPIMLENLPIILSGTSQNLYTCVYLAGHRGFIFQGYLAGHLVFRTNTQ